MKHQATLDISTASHGIGNPMAVVCRGVLMSGGGTAYDSGLVSANDITLTPLAELGEGRANPPTGHAGLIQLAECVRS